MYENHEREVTAVPSICMTMFENEHKLLENHFKIEQKTKFWDCELKMSFYNCDLGFSRCCIPMRMCLAKPVDSKHLMLWIYE